MGIFIRFIKSLRKKEAPQEKIVKPSSPVSASAVVAPERSFSRLRQDGESYYFTNTVPYHEDRSFRAETIEKVFSFAYSMTFGREGAHRDHRSGGMHTRRKGEIFANTFQGKLAECAVCNFFHKIGFETVPDFETYDLGKWDTVDITVGGKEISVKSTKSFGHLLLLETKDWDKNACYIPNKDSGNGEYDAFVFIRLDPSCEDLLKRCRMLYTDEADYEVLKGILMQHKWSYNCVGFVTRDDLKYIIKNGFIIPQGAMLNGSTPMDAENYYIQTGDMRPMEELKEIVYDR